ncbi:hypothetical protein ACFL5V_08655 [Fibrobacterota bacterium]
MIQLFQILISSLIPVLIFQIVYHHSQNLKLSCWGGMGFACYPASISLSTLYMSETLFSFVLLLVFYLSLHVRRINTYLVPLALTCSVYIRPVSILILPLVYLRMYVNGKKTEYVKRSSVLFLSVLILLAPWIYRNYQKLGALVFISTNFGINLYIGNHNGATGRYTEDSFFKEHPVNKFGEIESSKIFKKEAVDFITANPFKTIYLFLKKLCYLSFQDRSTVYQSFELNKGKRFSWWQRLLAVGNNAYYLIFFLLFIGCLGFGIWGIWKGRTIQTTVIIYPLPVIVFLLSHSMFFAEDRFKFPVTSLMIISTLLFINEFTISKPRNEFKKQTQAFV